MVRIWGQPLRFQTFVNMDLKELVKRGSPCEIRKYISRGESEIIEFKESIGEWKEIIETISAPKVYPRIAAEKINAKPLRPRPQEKILELEAQCAQRTLRCTGKLHP